MQFEEDEVNQKDEDPEFTGTADAVADEEFLDDDAGLPLDDDAALVDDEDEDDTAVADL